MGNGNLQFSSTGFLEGPFTQLLNPATGVRWTQTELTTTEFFLKHEVATAGGVDVSRMWVIPYLTSRLLNTTSFLVVNEGAALTDNGIVPAVALTGTATASITEADIVTGGKTIILTLTGDTWVTAGATFDAQRQNIINGIDSAQSEALGWDNVVKALQGVAGVVRTSNTVVTITLDAFATYNITATETITATIPGTATTGASSPVATPTFAITAVAGGTTAPYLTLLGVGS